MLSRADAYRRSLGRALLAAVVVILLSGCTPASGIRARVVDGQVEFLLCQEMDATEIVARSALEGDGVDYQTRWSATGASTFERESVIVYGVAPDGWKETLAPKELSAPSETIYFAICDDTVTEVAVFAAGSLSREWSSETGAVNSQNPCD